MNILYLCEEYPPGKNGGIGTIVQVLGRALVKQGHNVYVAGLYPHGYAQAGYEEDEGVKVWRLRYKTDIGLIKNNYATINNVLRKLLKYSGILHIDTKVSTGAFFNFIQQLIKEYAIDIIEMPDWNTMLYNSLTTATVPAFNVPLVVKLHGGYSYLLQQGNKPLQQRIYNTEKKLLQRADAIASVSNYTAETTKQLFHLQAPVTVLHNGIAILPVPNIAERDNNKVIYTGALMKSKGVFSLLQAWNSINKQFPALTLHLYGKGVTSHLKQFISKEAAASIVFHGHVPRQVLLQELNTAAIAVFPSYAECFAMAPLEALAAGCAVIYTERTSGPELITHNSNGLLVNPDDIDAIATAIQRLTTDNNFRIAIAKAGKEMVTQKFNIDYAAGQHIDFYKKVIAGFRNTIN